MLSRLFREAAKRGLREVRELEDQGLMCVRITAHAYKDGVQAGFCHQASFAHQLVYFLPQR